MQTGMSDRAAWLAARKRVIGGSDIAALAGLSPWKTPLDVYLDKRGLVEEQPDNPAMRAGRKLEPVILDMYQEDTGRIVTAGEFVHLPAPMDFIGGTPDGLTDGPVVEAKAVGSRMAARWGEPGTDDVPEYYLVQCAWYMRLTGRDVCDVAALFGGQKFGIYTIRRTPDLEAALVDIAAKFWHDHVLPGVPPAVDGSASAREWLARQYPRESRPELLPADDEAAALAERLTVAREDEEVASSRVALLENQIRAKIGDAAGIQGDGWRATWKATKDGTKTDWEAVVKEIGAPLPVIQKHTTTRPGVRRFLFTPPKEA